MTATSTTLTELVRQSQAPWSPREQSRIRRKNWSEWSEITWSISGTIPPQLNPVNAHSAGLMSTVQNRARSDRGPVRRRPALDGTRSLPITLLSNCFCHNSQPWTPPHRNAENCRCHNSWHKGRRPEHFDLVSRAKGGEIHKPQTLREHRTCGASP